MNVLQWLVAWWAPSKYPPRSSGYFEYYHLPTVLEQQLKKQDDEEREEEEASSSSDVSSSLTHDHSYWCADSKQDRFNRARPMSVHCSNTARVLHSHLTTHDNNNSATAMTATATKRTVRIVVISDTHELEAGLELPSGDILIHCGDILCNDVFAVSWYSDHCVNRFLKWFNAQPHRHKIMVAGNHDAAIKRLSSTPTRRVTEEKKKPSKKTDEDSGVEDECFGAYSPHASQMHKLAYPAIYLNDEHVTVAGLKIYGSPRSFRQNTYSPNGAFQCDATWDKGGRTNNIHRQRTEALEVDIVVTHQDPHHRIHNNRAQMETFLLDSVRPRLLHLCGHAHGLHGLRYAFQHHRAVSPVGSAAHVLSGVACVNASSMRSVKILREKLYDPIVVDVEVPTTTTTTHEHSFSQW